MKINILITVILTLFIKSVFAQDLNAELSKCKTISSAQARLDCYDGIGSQVNQSGNQQAASAQAYQQMSLDDLKVDIKQLVGKRVSVNALIRSAGGGADLASSALDTSAIRAFTENLPREDRIQVNKCGMSGCDGQFYGVVTKTNSYLPPNLSIEKVEWR